MTSQSVRLIPIMNTASGSCLTSQNWQEAGIEEVAYALPALLIKPGAAFLKTMAHFSLYSGWDKDWVLNASMPMPNKEGQYTFRSLYDGARVSCTVTDLVEIILHLKPHKVVLPEGFYVVGHDILQALSRSSKLLIPFHDRNHYEPDRIHGFYYVLDAKNPCDLSQLIGQHERDFPTFECYIAGALTDSLLAQLSQARVNVKVSLESDNPAMDGCIGVVYCSKGMIDLRQKDYAMQFEPIDSACSCPTCSQSFTRAYLHHLLEHTPLLCQRLLIQHNVFSRIIG